MWPNVTCAHTSSAHTSREGGREGGREDIVWQNFPYHLIMKEVSIPTCTCMHACWYVRMYIVHSLVSDSLVLCQNLRLPLLLPSFPLSLSSSHLSRLQYQSAKELFESGEEGKGRAAMQC